jgi:hypothetical protein
MSRRLFHPVLGLALAMVMGGRALAQHPIPESERWATITNPGNAPYTVVSPIGYPDRYVGQVNYEYQISRTEVTGTEWFEFVQAYAPYVQEDAVAADTFTSRSVITIGYRQYLLPAANANRPVEIGWHFAARYMNWLHNGKSLTPDAFESGAYDTSTFGEHPGGGYTDQISRSPGATYWVPSVDEWIKSAHFDPNRYGEGMPGYWLASNSSDTPPIFGSPSNGGETSAGGQFVLLLPNIVSYPGIQSPWGLWDTSGGFSEWTEDVHYTQFAEGHITRRIQGPSWKDDRGSILTEGWEYLDSYRSQSPFGLIGLRVARAVPGAGSAWISLCAVPFLARRRRRFDESLQLSHGRFAGVRVRASVP